MKTKKNVVCILTAGIGSRMGPLGKVLNKSLFVFKKKAIISNIIDKFPIKETKFVIGLGYKGNQVKSFLKIAHPKNKFVFVKIKKFQGIGSGPGHSLLCCKKYLQKPFYFISCDTIVSNKIPLNLNYNWIGSNKFFIRNNKNYCNLKIYKNKIIKIFDKQNVKDESYRQFIGLCYIKSYKFFWKGLSKNKLIKKEIQISNGLKSLIDKDIIYKKKFDWIDLGNLINFKDALLKYEKYDFSKSNECIYFYKDRVIKFFADSNIIKNRVKKVRNKKNIFPKIDILTKEFYSYKYFKGDIFYNNLSRNRFKKFLEFSQNKLWLRKKIYNKKIFMKICNSFYRSKTIIRFKDFKKKYSNFNAKKKINNKYYPDIKYLLLKLDWDKINDGIQSYIHGDLQFDNVIYNKNKKTFRLIDWRQDFGKSIKIGDLYYDFAKIYGGMLIDYSKIKLNKFKYYEKGKNIYFNLPRIKNFKLYEKIFFKMINDKKMDVKKVKVLTGLIFLNMSPLHNYPFDKVLYNFSRKILYEEIL